VCINKILVGTLFCFIGFNNRLLFFDDSFTYQRNLHFRDHLKLTYMQRKNFLKNSFGLLSAAVILESCKKAEVISATTTTGGTSGACVVAPTETEGPFPYPGGEITNPLNRPDITGGQTGVPLTVTFTLVNTNDNCAVLSGYRIDIWHCNAKGYYSGYGNQPGVSGTLSYAGSTWLRGYQTTDESGKVTFTTIYPGWYASRATHIHLEVFDGTTMVKTGQVTMPEAISDAIHVTSGYNGSINTTRNAADSVFGNSATDLANQTMALSGSIAAGYAATQTIGIPV
jgi:protocatechuate 3,4-dioxygenase beta subunit